MLSHPLDLTKGSLESLPAYTTAVVSGSDCSPAPLEKSSTLTTQAAPPEHFIVHRDLKPWRDLALPKNHELVKNLRHLTFQGIVDISALMEYTSPPFKQLSHLEFIHTSIAFSPSKIKQFSPFKHTLEHISFTICSISTRLFAHLIDYFLNLKSITFDWLSHDHSFKLKEKLFRPRRISRTLERLTVNLQHGSNEKLQEALSDLGLKFNELDLKSFDPIRFSCFEAGLVIRLFGGRATCLRLPLFRNGRRNPL